MKYFFLLFVLLAQSCASIVDGTIESKGLIYFSSSPSNAIVRINGVRICQTPCQQRIYSGDFKYITFEKDGFSPIKIDATENDISAALAGNIIFGGGVGLGLDLLTGRATVNKDSVNVVFEK
jgi:hypothetical protein